MAFAVLSDIHSNWQALETALEHLEGRGIKDFYVLGDTVGYGASPNECLKWAFENARVNLAGNHEQAVWDEKLRPWFNLYARQAIEWTAGELEKPLVERMKELTPLRVEKDWTFAHGSPDAPEEFRYLMNFSDSLPSFKVMKNSVCFVGHTHVPACFCAEEKKMEPMAPGKLVLDKTKRYILNPGSVGQPRDGDPRLSFGIYDPEEHAFELVRLKYDNQKAARKIRSAGLPGYLADRLL